MMKVSLHTVSITVVRDRDLSIAAHTGDGCLEPDRVPSAFGLVLEVAYIPMGITDNSFKVVLAFLMGYFPGALVIQVQSFLGCMTLVSSSTTAVVVASITVIHLEAFQVPY